MDTTQLSSTTDPSQPRQLSPPPLSQPLARQFVPDSQSPLDSQEVPINYAFTQSDESNNSELNDEFILTALQNPRDRITLLKLELDLERFIISNDTRLSFPPMSSYQRLIVHRVAQYFNLEHTAIDIYPQQRTVVLVKTPETKMPPVLFREMNVNKEQEATSTTRSAPPKAIKIMQRQPTRDESATSGGGSGSGGKKEATNVANSNATNTKSPEKKEDIDRTRTTPKTLEEREQEYAKARARIFSSNELKTETANSQQQSTELSSLETNEERDTLQKSTSSKSSTPQQQQQQQQPPPQQQQQYQTSPVQQPTMRQPTKSNKIKPTNGMDAKGEFESSRSGWAENVNPRSSNTKPFWSSNAENDYNDYNDFYSYDMVPMYVNHGYAYPPPPIPQGDNQEIWPYPEPPYSKSAPPQPPPPVFAQPFPRKNHSFHIGSNNFHTPNNVHNYDQMPPQPPLGHSAKGGSRQWNNYSRDERVASPSRGPPDYHGKPNVRNAPPPEVVQYMPQPMGHVSPPPPSMPNYPAYDQAYPPPPPQPYNNDPAWFPPLYNPGYPHRGGPLPPPSQPPRQAPVMSNPYSYPSYSQATQFPTGPPGAPISYDYERRPPKSTELFDPKDGVTKKMSQMSVSSDRGSGSRGRGGRGGGGGGSNQYYNPNNAWSSSSSSQPRDRYQP